jgi:hypothetical protein
MFSFRLHTQSPIRCLRSTEIECFGVLGGLNLDQATADFKRNEAWYPVARFMLHQ